MLKFIKVLLKGILELLTMSSSGLTRGSLYGILNFLWWDPPKGLGDDKKRKSGDDKPCVIVRLDRTISSQRILNLFVMRSPSQAGGWHRAVKSGDEKKRKSGDEKKRKSGDNTGFEILGSSPRMTQNGQAGQWHKA